MPLPTLPQEALSAIGNAPRAVVTISGQPRHTPWPATLAEALRIPEMPRRVVLTLTQGVRHAESFTQKQSFTAPLPDAPLDALLETLWNVGYGQWLVQLPENDLHVLASAKRVTVRERPATRTHWPEEHNRSKSHVLDPDRDAALLHALEMLTPEGTVRATQADKFRQVNHLLAMIIADIGPMASPTIVDAGCGKAYLSIALHYALRRQGGTGRLIGIDTNPHVIDQAWNTATALGLPDTDFHVGRIADLATLQADDVLLLALHACDTATDEALHAGLRAQARAMYVAPCCHHHVQKQMHKATMPAWAAPLLDDGIIRERLGDILTDVMRRDIVRAHGYDAHIQEFVSPEHTQKNLLIRARREAAYDGTVRTAALEAVRAYAATVNVRPSLMDMIA